jgi:transposase
LPPKGHLVYHLRGKIHTNKNIINLINNSGNFIKFTPPYSPNNNPVEHTFSLIKNIYRKKIQRIDNIKRTKENIIDFIDECIIDVYYLYDNNFNNLFKRAFKYTYKIEEKQLRDRLLIQK